MGVTNSNKVADTAAICCGDQFKMTLALTAAPDIVTNPTDIVLALVCSGSAASPCAPAACCASAPGKSSNSAAASSMASSGSRQRRRCC